MPNARKHEKFIVVGDFNVKTSLAFQKFGYDRTNVIPDDDCNSNGTHLKKFCMSNRLPITSTFFDYPNENRYRWYSCDIKTKKVNDYLLTEKYVQKYVRECIVKPDMDLDNDYFILMASLYTPRLARPVEEQKER